MIQYDTIRKWILFLAILMSGGNPLIPRVPLLVLIVGLYLLLPGLRWVLDRRLFPVLALLAAILTISVLRPGGMQLGSLLIRSANFAAAVLLLNIYLNETRDTLVKDFWPILKWMAIQALATIVLGYAIGFLFFGVMVDNVPYRTLAFLFNYHIVIENAAIRPDGFFWEPGVFQFYLNLYLYMGLFVFRDWRHSALALVAVLSTQSTTGVVIAVMLLGAVFLERVWYGSLRVKVAVVLIGMVLAIPVGLFAWQNIESKFYGDLKGSSLTREYDLYTGLNIVAENWTTGIGFDYDEYKQAASRLGFADSVLDETKMGDHGNTDGILFLLYSIGVPLSIPFLIGMFRQYFFQHRLLLGMLMFLSLLGEPLTFTPIPLLLIFSGLTWRLDWRGARAPGGSGEVLQQAPTAAEP